MNINNHELHFKKKPDFYFLQDGYLNSLICEKEAYPDPSIIFKDEKSGLYRYNDVWFIPLQDQFLSQCLIDKQTLKTYKFNDNKNDWDHKVPVVNKDGVTV